MRIWQRLAPRRIPRPNDVNNPSCFGMRGYFCENENPAIVAGFQIGYADKQKTNKGLVKNVFVLKAPSGRELSSVCETEGECATSIM